MSSRNAGLLLACVVVAVTGAAITAATDPEVTPHGRDVVWYEGPELRAELDFGWAARHLGDEWLVLRLGLTTAGNASPVVERQGIRVLTPRGHSLPMVDQEEFRRVWGKLRMTLDRIDAWGPPTGRFLRFEDPCGQWFIAPPSSFADRARLRVLPGRWCAGPLVFNVPGGVQPGGWVLTMELEESRPRIPFALEE
jgi:hypothetical protein